MTVGRPTEGELDRIEELVEEYFVKDSYAIRTTMWDDDDLHMTAYSTLGTNVNEGYPKDVIQHRQIIEYRRDDDLCIYQNFARRAYPGLDQILDRKQIDF